MDLGVDDMRNANKLCLTSTRTIHENLPRKKNSQERSSLWFVLILSVTLRQNEFLLFSNQSE